MRMPGTELGGHGRSDSANFSARSYKGMTQRRAKNGLKGRRRCNAARGRIPLAVGCVLSCTLLCRDAGPAPWRQLQQSLPKGGAEEEVATVSSSVA